MNSEPAKNEEARNNDFNPEIVGLAIEELSKAFDEYMEKANGELDVEKEDKVLNLLAVSTAVLMRSLPSLNYIRLRNSVANVCSYAKNEGVFPYTKKRFDKLKENNNFSKMFDYISEDEDDNYIIKLNSIIPSFDNSLVIVIGKNKKNEEQVITLHNNGENLLSALKGSSIVPDLAMLLFEERLAKLTNPSQAI